MYFSSLEFENFFNSFFMNLKVSYLSSEISHIDEEVPAAIKILSQTMSVEATRKILRSTKVRILLVKFLNLLLVINNFSV